MALLSYLQAGLQGAISSKYASTSDFSQFPGAGAAVQVRNASYPLASIAQFAGTLSSLQGTPACASMGTPALAAVTNAAYGSDLSVSGTIVVWGTGFSASGGNSIQLTRSGASDTVSLNAMSGGYFWDLSPNQINATLPPGMANGQWLLAVKNSCGATSANMAVTLR
jgi:hypothetical protein